MISLVQVFGQEVILFWAVGRDEELIRNYIRHQEKVDKQYEIQHSFF